MRVCFVGNVMDPDRNGKKGRKNDAVNERLCHVA